MTDNQSKQPIETVILDARTGETGTVSQWVSAFEEVWQAPHGRLERLLALLSDDVTLRAPTVPPVSRGKTACRRAFERAFRAMPDLTATVHRWAVSENALFIEMTFHATIGGHAVEWPNVDRVVFEDGAAVLRDAHFDSARVRSAFMRNPRAWVRSFRLRTGL